MRLLVGILILLILIIVLIDALPLMKTWISRIHIGRYESENAWRESLVNKSCVWLNNTPKIKVTDNTRLTVIDMLKGNYSKSTIQHWQQAALLLGLNDYLINNSSDKLISEIERYLKTHFTSDGQWANKAEFIDCGILSYAVMKYDKNDKYKLSYDYTYELIRNHLGGDGTVKYRKAMSNYRYVDTVGFICPFLIKYGLKYNCDEAIQLAIRQIREYSNHGFDKDNIIPFHAYDVDNGYKLGLCGWGRGLGWFAIGLIDAWNELPTDSKYKDELEETIVSFSKSILKLQLDNGGFSWIVTRKESRIDSSTTSTLAYFLKCASEIDDIRKECLRGYKNAINYLISVTRRDGAIDFSQGDTKDIGVYSMLFDVLPFTQGFALRCIVNNKVNINNIKLEEHIV